jgi:thiol-disulfide isomerase/thioredoxin
MLSASFTLLQVLLSVLTGSAAPASSAPPTTLSGHLHQAPAGDSVELWLNYHRYKAALSPAGDFKLPVPNFRAPTFGTFAYAGQRTKLYLTPGDQLVLTTTFQDFDKALTYSGRGAAANNYLAQALYKFEYGPAGDVPRPSKQLQPTTTPAEARQYADAFRQQQQAFLTAYAKAHSLPAIFQQQQALDIELQWARFLLDYPGYVRYRTKQEAALSPTYFDFLRQLPLRQLDSQVEAEQESVMRFLSSYTSRLDALGPLTTDSATARRLYTQATADLGPGRARDQAVYHLLSDQLIMGDARGVLAAYPIFRTQNRDSAAAKGLRTMLRKQAPLLPGQPAPVFTLHDAANKPVALAEFKGKVVYLDFWASWCVPCLAEAPAAVALKKQFEGRDVVFLYISVDRRAEDWQKSMATHPLTSPNSVHLRDVAGTPAAVQGMYQANAIPNYWLIGRDGRIVQAHAPRPSDGPKTVAAIENALNTK